jgi:hypothetical protein
MKRVLIAVVVAMVLMVSAIAYAMIDYQCMASCTRSGMDYGTCQRQCTY